MRTTAGEGKAEGKQTTTNCFHGNRFRTGASNMEIGNEISQKIRSAIKAKLVELGAYVDDELPDYIMVLVANKKNQQQMSDDLSLFLGKNTDNFTSWLHLLLTKLQSITAEIPQNKTSVVEPAKSQIEPQPITKPVTSEKSSPPMRANLPTSAEKKEPQPTAPKPRVKQEDKKIVQKEHIEEPILTFTAENDEFIEEDLPKDKPAQPKKSVSSSANKTSEVTAKIQPRVRARSPLRSTDSSSRPSSMVSRISRTKSPPQHIAAVSPTKIEKSRSTSRRPVDRPSIRRPSQDRRGSQAGGHPGGPGSRGPGSRGPGSVVGSVITHQHESDDEYDPLNPAVGSVASVVRVTERRSSIPPAMQANRSLLMKAVSDARKSIDSATKRLEEKGIKNQVSEVQQPIRGTGRQSVRALSSERTRSIQLPSRQHYQQKSVSAIRPTRSPRAKMHLVSKSSREDPLHSSRTDENKYMRIHKVIKTEVNSDEETEHSPAPPSPAIKREILDEADELDLTEEIEIEFEQDRRLIECRESPESQPSQSEETLYHTETDERKVEETAEPNPPEYHEAVEEELPSYVDSDQENDELPPTAIMEQPRKVESRKRSYERAPSPKFIVTLDGTGVPPNKLKKNANMDILTSSIIQRSTQNSGILFSAEPDSNSEDEISSPTSGNKPPEKCKFWPNCKNGKVCEYHHPKVKCTSFPNCKFGDKCLYIHPSCKFGAMCTRRDCSYTHAMKRSPVQIQPIQVPVYHVHPKALTKVISPPKPAPTVCRFFPQCHNMNCTFVHPKPCRFGLSCNNKTNCHFHHPKLPEKAKLKWSATNV